MFRNSGKMERRKMREEILKALREIYDKIRHTEKKEITPETVLDEKSTGLDSLGMVEFLVGIEERFGITISDEEAKNLVFVRELIDLIERKLK